MKKLCPIALWPALFVMASGFATAKNFAPRPTTEVCGTVSDSGEERLELQLKNGRSPMRFITNVTTEFVDTDGRAVQSEALKFGAPVTVRYWTSAEHLVASEVVVGSAKRVADKKGTPPPSGAPIVATDAAAPSRSESDDADASEKVSTRSGQTSGEASAVIVLKSDSSPTPINYIQKDTTNWVDESGAPVNRHRVKPGTPITVHYVKVGDTLLASKVVVKSASGESGRAGEKREVVKKATPVDKKFVSRKKAPVQVRDEDRPAEESVNSRSENVAERSEWKRMTTTATTAAAIPRPSSPAASLFAPR